MAQEKPLKIALVGNPNSGKSTLFNLLTGLNQKIGNFPGVTVDKRSGFCKLPHGRNAEFIDLPGTYSIYPRSLDERIVAGLLLDHHSDKAADLVVVVTDATNLKRGLLLVSQVIDIGIPVILALNMMDLAAKAGLSFDLVALSKKLGIPIYPINARNGEGLIPLKHAFESIPPPSGKMIFKIWDDCKPPIEELRNRMGVDNDYEAFQFLDQPNALGFLSPEEIKLVDEIREKHHFIPGKFQGAETVQRYGFIQDLLQSTTQKLEEYSWKKLSHKIDAVLLHKVWGYLIFFGVLLIIFQSIFAWADLPMDFIDSLFARLSTSTTQFLPPGPLTSLLTEGIIPGIGGIFMFIPQIALLFAFISLLEESGYMARVVFLMDKIMRKFGLNGKSVVPLISGVACAIPAIMATRTIDNWKERTITILVTPLISCSARLPVFTILVSMIIPNQKLWGFFNYQGLVLMSLYLLGFLTAIGAAWVMHKMIRVKERSFLIMEMPTYRKPKGMNVGLTILEKTKAFVFEAGKIILAISIILWVLASYGPGNQIQQAQAFITRDPSAVNLSPKELENKIAAYKLEHSYAGIIGKAIEPVIKPLGFDWKIGIALVTSFAAREVFVGTMATIYSIGTGDEDTDTIKNKMKNEINPETGGPRFTTPVGLSLLIFYTFAMQCMSTLAVVYRETKGWKWPLIQLAYMSALAYFSALLVFQVFS